MPLSKYFTQAKFDQYQSFLKSSGLSRSSIRRKLSSLYSFQKYLNKQGLVSSESLQTQHAKLRGLALPKQFSFNLSNPFQSPNFTKYLTIATILVLFTGLGIGLYTQTILKAKKNFAYSTASNPTRAGRQLSFQGRLTDTAGDPIISSTPILFRLYNAGTGGTMVYSSDVGNSQTVTPDQNGVFSVVIGKTHGTEIDQTVFSNYSEIWLEITAGGETMSPRQQIATVAYALNSETLQGLPPSASGLKDTVLVIDGQGNLNLGETSPSIKSASGTLGIEGQALLLKASDSSGGNIEINPDASGVIKLTTEGATPGLGGGFINATNANLSSGNLFNGQINNENTGYNFLEFTNYDVGSTFLRSRFSVSALGNVNVGSTLNSTNISIGNTLITSSASEINFLHNLNPSNGSIIIGNGSNLTSLAIGASTNVLLSNGSNPYWADSSSLGKTYTSNNGITLTGYNFQLGGPLVQNTRLNIGDTEVIFFDYTTGHVGIGTTSSAYKLDVTGISNFQNISIGGTLITSDAVHINYLSGLNPTIGTLIVGDGTSLTNTAVGQSGQFLMSNGSNLPVWSSDLVTSINSLIGGITLDPGQDISISSIGNTLTITNTSTLQSVLNRGATTVSQISFNNSDSPFNVGSTGLVANLNADLLDGLHSSSFLSSGAINGTQNFLAKFGSSNSVVDSLLFDNGTNIGIGTTNPTNPLTIVSSADTPISITTSGNGYQALRINSIGGDAGINLYGGNNYWAYQSGINDGAFSIIDRGTDNNTPITRLKIAKTTGNVGIGTTNPLSLLDVGGTGNFLNISIGNTLITSSAQELNLLDGTLSTTGSLLVGNGSNISNLNIGASGYALISNGSNPIWVDTSSFAKLYTANNGIGLSGDTFQLGGELIQNTRLNIGDTESFYIAYPSGNIGIGTTAPTEKVELVGNSIFRGHMAIGTIAQIDQTQNVFAGSNIQAGLILDEEITNLTGKDWVNGIGNYLYLNPDSDAEADVYGIDSDIVTAYDNNSNYGTINGIYGSVEHQGGGNVDYLNGLEFYTYNSSVGGTVAYGNGINSGYQVYGGVTQDAYGVASYNGIFGNSGSIIGIDGIMSNIGIWGTGSITTAHGLHAVVTNQGTGTINTAVGLFVEDPDNSNTVNNNYGIYIQSQAGEATNSYNFYSAGNTSRNYFAGSIGIGPSATSPIGKLQVTGGDAFFGTSAFGVGRTSANTDVRIDGNLDVGGTIFGQFGGTFTGTLGFNQITSGLNVGNTLVIGDGSSLTYTGTGIINASHLSGYSYSNLPYVSDATDSTLTRSGSGPYTLGLNLGSTNIWTAPQTFNRSTYFPSSGIWSNLGRIGIGTTDPWTQLHIENLLSGTDANSILISNSGTGAGTANSLYYSLAGVGTGKITNTIDSDQTSASLTFSTYYNSALTEAMRIYKGNLGIGTTAPQSKLDLISSTDNLARFMGPNNYAITLDNTADGSKTVWGAKTAQWASMESHEWYSAFTASRKLDFISGANNPITLQVGNTEYVRLNNNGNFGIGTTAPVGKLQVVGGDVVFGNANMAAGKTTPSTDLRVDGNLDIGGTIFGQFGGTFSGTLGFNQITSGLNIGNTLVMGNGSSLSYTGTGIINASHLSGYSYNNLPYVSDATNSTLTRSGSGPYTLGLNLGSTNTWTAPQSFNNTAQILSNNYLTFGQGTNDPVNGIKFYDNTDEHYRLSYDGNSGSGNANVVSLQYTPTNQTIWATKNGYFGVGTTNPQAPLSVVGVNNLGGRDFSFDVDPGQSNRASRIRLYNSASPSLQTLIGHETDQSGDFAVYTSNNSGTSWNRQFWVDNGGDVIIGTGSQSHASSQSDLRLDGNLDVGGTIFGQFAGTFSGNLGFNQIGSGLNIGNTLVVGNGSSLTATGTGIINATHLNNLDQFNLPYVNNSTNTTLVRSGIGTSANPYTLGLNLGATNSWTGPQTFASANITNLLIGGTAVTTNATRLNYLSNLNNTAGSVIYGNGTALANTAVGTSGQILMSNAANAPVWTDINSLINPYNANNGIGLSGQTFQLGGPLIQNTRLTVGSTEVMYFDYATGRIGLGNTAPGAYKLNITGTVYSSGSLTTAGDLLVQGSDVYDDSGDLHLSGEDNVYIKMDYNNNDADIRAIIFGKNTALGTGITGTNELMRINENGNVGIGTSAPIGKLQVTGGDVYFGTTAFAGTTTTNTDVHIDGNLDVGGTIFGQFNGTFMGNLGFNQILSGTNTSQNLVIGNGSSLSATGTGVINATQLNGLNQYNLPYLLNAANGTLTRSGVGTSANPYTLALNLGSSNTWTALQTFGNISVGNTATITTLSLGGTNVITNATRLNYLSGINNNAGSLIYGTGSSLANTAVGTSGQLLMSNGTGAPFWVNPSSVGSTYAFNNGIGLSGSTVQLGGPIIQNTRLNVGNTEVVFLQSSSGYVGIGKTNPGYKLDVSGTIQGTMLRTSSGSQWFGTTLEANTITDVNDITFLDISTTGGRFHRNVADSNPLLRIQQENASSTGDILQLLNNSSTLMVVRQNGNVGIGTTSPIGRLQVVGGDAFFGTTAFGAGRTTPNTDVRIDGNLDVGGTIFGQFNGTFSGNMAFSNIVSGTNVSQNLTIGAGSSLTTTGTGVINATQLGGVDRYNLGYILNATNGTLTRSGVGTSANPYTLGINLGATNTWTGVQTFNSANIIALSLGGTAVTTNATRLNYLSGINNTAGSLIYGNGTALANSAVGTSGQILMSNGTSAPTWVNAASVGSTYAFNNGIGVSSSVVQLGGPLIQNTRLTVGATEVMFFNFSNGRIGVGNTAPGAYKFNVTGSIYASSGLTAATGITTSGDLMVQGSDVYDDSGDLHLSGEDNVYIKMDYNNNDADIRAIIFGKNTALGTGITGTNELMRINENGNVGIGTTFPIGRLQVVGGDAFFGSTAFGVGHTTTSTDVHIDGNLDVGGTIFGQFNGTFSGNLAFDQILSGTNTSQNLVIGNGSSLSATGTGVINATQLGGVDRYNLSYIFNAANGTLTRSGVGTSANPYALALNLGATNTWTGRQTFGNISVGNTATITTLSLGGTNVITNATRLNYLSGINNTAGSLIYGNGTALANSAVGTSGQVLMSNGASAPTWTNVNTLINPYTAGNGTTMNGTNIELGGNLTKNTNIGTSSFRLNFLGLGGSQALTLAQNGNVGIGNTNPTVPLDISGSNYPVTRITRNTLGTNNSVTGLILKSKSANDMNNGFGVDLDFAVEDNIGIQNPIAIVRARRQGSDNSGVLQFVTYNAGVQSEKMHISANGSVGIGTTTPSSRLQVTGGDVVFGTNAFGVGRTSTNTDLHIDGNLDVGGTIFGTFIGNIAFDQLDSGTNTTANMVIGTGASLSTSGTGIINANRLAGLDLYNLPYVLTATNGTLSRSGVGTSANPYTLALNLGATNTWVAPQNFNNSLYVTGRLGIATINPRFDAEIGGALYVTSLGTGTSAAYESFTAVGFPPAGFSTGVGNSAFVRDAATFFDTAGSARNGAVPNNGMAWMQTTVNMPTSGYLRYNWRVSSESGWDYLLVCIDRATCNRTTYDQAISGTVAWTQVMIPLAAGNHTVRWGYAKDGSGTGGTDQGWVDNILFGLNGTGNIYADGSIGIGTTNPNYNLDVVGDANISTNLSVGGTFNLSVGASNNYVLTSDATGNARWAPATGGSTYTAGNGTTMTGNNIELGGQLTRNTQIGTSSFGLSFVGLGNTQSLYIKSNGFVGIGTTNPNARFTVLGDGSSATPDFSMMNANGSVNLEIRTGLTDLNNIFIGTTAGAANTTGTFNTALGDEAMAMNTTGSQNVALGRAALINNNGSYNTSQGAFSMFSNQSGGYNTINGYRSLYANTTGSNNVTLGAYTLNTGTTLNSNIAIGYGAGQNLSVGSSNIFLGNGAGASGAYSNRLYIGNGQNPAIYGNLSNNYIGIGTTNPQANIDVNGNIRISSSDNRSLSFYGSTTSGTNTGAINFYESDVNYGTRIIQNSLTDTLDFSTIMGGTTYPRMSVGYGGNVGIGTTAPASRLQVVGGDIMFGTTAFGVGRTTTNTDLRLDGNLDVGGTIYGTISGTFTGTLPFNQISSATNTTANLIIGTGSSLSTTGTGIINANQLSGIGASGFIQNQFTANQSSSFRISGNGMIAGRLGLGSTSTATFNVVGNGNFTTSLSVGSTLSTATINIGNGTSARPSLSFTSNPDTGIYLPATDVFGISTAGAERMRIAANGNVGIGTTNPTSRLTVLGDGNSGTPDFSLMNANGTVNLEVRTGQTNLLNTFIGVNVGRINGTGSNNTIQGHQAFFNNTSGSYNEAQGVEALYRNTTGSRNAAQGFNALYNNTTGSNNMAQGYQALYYSSTGNYNIAQGYNAGTFLASGVGNSSPQNSLYLGYDTRALSVGGTNEIVIGSGAIGNGSNSVVIGSDSIGKTTLKGNVGIGTTGPLDALHVYRAGNAALDIQDANSVLRTVVTGGVNYIQSGLSLTNDSKADLRFTSMFAYTDWMTIKGATGNVGIGTTNPTSKLHIIGNGTISTSLSVGTTLSAATIAIGNGSVTNPGLAFTSNTDTGIYLPATDVFGISTAGAERMRIAANGTVGIGTTNPQATLEIANIGTSGPLFRLNSTDTSLATNQELGRIEFKASDASANGVGVMAQIRGVSGGTTNNFGNLSLQTRSLATSAWNDNLFLRANGNVGVGHTNPLRTLDVGGSFIRMQQSTAAPALANNGDIAMGSLGTGTTAGRIWIRSQNTNFRFQSVNNVADYSEYFYQSAPSETGDLMVLESDQSGIPGTGKTSKSNKSHQSRLLGVVTTHGTGYNDFNDDRGGNPNFANVGLLGHVDTKICTENGPIQAGDALTSSSIPGVAMKATQAGEVIGYATQNYNNSDPSAVSKITVYINPSYYDPDLSLTATGQINVGYNVSDEVLASLGYSGTKNELESAHYSLTDSFGKTIDRIAQFKEIASAKINAGLVSATNIITDKLVANTAIANKLKTNIISPMSEGEHITITANTDVIGKLTAPEASIEALTVKTATVSTLYADNIISSEGSFGDLMSSKISNLREEMKKIIAENMATSSSQLSATASAVLAEAETWGFEISTDSAKLNGDLALSDNLVIGAQLMVNGDSHLASAFISGTFKAGEIQIRDNVIETANTALYIQPSGQGTVNILNNLFIAQNGQIEINGSVKVNGNFTANEATISGSLIANLLSAQDATISGTLAANKIETGTLKIATDSATSLIIADSQANPNASTSAQLTSNAAAGIASLPAGATELTILTNKLSPSSMVYLTPNASTQNQVLYIKNKTGESFTIGLDSPLASDLSLNWWIIN